MRAALFATLVAFTTTGALGQAIQATTTTQPGAHEQASSAPAAPANPTATPDSVDAAPPAGPTPAAATDSAALLPAGPPDGCELHIWPAERMSSRTTGWLSGFGMIGSLVDQSAHAKQDANNQGLLATALDSPSQLDDLVALNLRTMLDLTPGTTIVRHETPLERKTINSVKTRRSDSRAKCYSELIVADVMYQKAAIYGRSLRTLFMYRVFDGQKIAKEYKAWGGNGLKLFPPKEGEDAVAALDELTGIYKRNFDEYSRNARTALARYHR